MSSDRELEFRRAIIIVAPLVALQVDGSTWGQGKYALIIIVIKIILARVVQLFTKQPINYLFY